MDKISKLLQKLSQKELGKIKEILTKLNSGDLKNLDIKQLKRRKDIFRVRLGDLRIIYRKNNQNKIFILSIARRNEKTYK